jgi:peptidoglycan/LPS O-acetylase OafA/YrhL
MILGESRSAIATRKEAGGVFKALLGASLTHGTLPIVVGIICAALFLVVLYRRPALRWALRYAIAAVTGAALGYAIAWYLGDVQDDFGITLAFSTRTWFAVGVAGAAVALTSLWRARPWRIATGIASVLLFSLLAAVGINATIGEYPTLRDALGISKVHALHLVPSEHAVTDLRPAEPLWQTGAQ